MQTEFGGTQSPSQNVTGQKWAESIRFRTNRYISINTNFDGK